MQYSSTRTPTASRSWVEEGSLDRIANGARIPTPKWPSSGSSATPTAITHFSTSRSGRGWRSVQSDMPRISWSSQIGGGGRRKGGGEDQAGRSVRIAGRKVLVAGASGFIGALLCRRLVDGGAEVPAFSRHRRSADRSPLTWWEG